MPIPLPPALTRAVSAPPPRHDAPALPVHILCHPCAAVQQPHSTLRRSRHTRHSSFVLESTLNCLPFALTGVSRPPCTSPASSDCEHCLTASMHRPCSPGPSSRFRQPPHHLEIDEYSPPFVSPRLLPFYLWNSIMRAVVKITVPVTPPHQLHCQRNEHLTDLGAYLV